MKEEPPTPPFETPWAKPQRVKTGEPPSTLLRLLIQPRASKTEITDSVIEGRLKVRIAAPPVEGEANDELCRFLSKKLRLPKAQIVVLRGETGRNKDLQITGASPQQIVEALKTPSNPA